MNEREGIDDFAMRVRKKHERINWDTIKDKYDLNHLMIGVTITRGTTNANIREYCLSRSGAPNLDEVLTKGRCRESMKQHDREMIGNTDTAGREITVKTEPTFAVKSSYGKYSSRFQLEKNQKAMFESSKKCKFCGFNWPHPKGPTSCPAWGKECHKCLQKNHFARCCQDEKPRKDSKRVVKATWRSCESAESSDSDEGTVGHVYELHNGMHERVTINIEGKPINFIVDTGSSSVIMTKQTYLEFNKDQEISLSNTDVKLTPYGSDNALKVMGKFKAMMQYNDKQIHETVYVVDTPERQMKCSLLSKRAAEKLGILTLI